MIQVISTYIKGIAIFLILIAYVEVAIPEQGYKEYISLVLGLILIFLILTPLNSILKKSQNPSEVSIINNTIRLERSIIENEKEFYNDERKKIVLDTYKKDLRAQITSFLSEYGTVLMLGIDVSESEESFGEIESLYIEIQQGGKKKKEGLIRIKPVKAIVQTEEDGYINNEEDEQIKKIKNRISDFYNLSVDNIYIKIL